MDTGASSARVVGSPGVPMVDMPRTPSTINEDGGASSHSNDRTDSPSPNLTLNGKLAGLQVSGTTLSIPEFPTLTRRGSDERVFVTHSVHKVRMVYFRSRQNRSTLYPGHWGLVLTTVDPHLHQNSSVQTQGNGLDLLLHIKRKVQPKGPWEVELKIYDDTGEFRSSDANLPVPGSDLSSNCSFSLAQIWKIAHVLLRVSKELDKDYMSCVSFAVAVAAFLTGAETEIVGKRSLSLLVTFTSCRLSQTLVAVDRRVREHANSRLTPSQIQQRVDDPAFDYYFC